MNNEELWKELHRKVEGLEKKRRKLHADFWYGRDFRICQYFNESFRKRQEKWLNR